jgi:hypothetical protein
MPSRRLKSVNAIIARPVPRSVRCATVKVRQHDPLAETVVLPQDELAVRRERKRLGYLSPAQVQRLLVAAELRKKVTEGERDE